LSSPLRSPPGVNTLYCLKQGRTDNFTP
jgi:hypothetical protein